MISCKKVFKGYISHIYEQMTVKKASDEVKFGEGEIVLRIDGSEILERQVSGFGTGCHVIVPKEYLGKKVKIIFGEEK